MDKELQNLLDNYEQAIYGYTEPIIPSIHQIHLLLDYISQLDIQVKKQKEAIEKVIKTLEIQIEVIKEQPSDNAVSDNFEINQRNMCIKLLKEVSE